MAELLYADFLRAATQQVYIGMVRHPRGRGSMILAAAECPVAAIAAAGASLCLACAARGGRLHTLGERDGVSERKRPRAPSAEAIAIPSGQIPWS